MGVVLSFDPHGVQLICVSMYPGQQTSVSPNVADALREGKLSGPLIIPETRAVIVPCGGPMEFLRFRSFIRRGQDAGVKQLVEYRCTRCGLVRSFEKEQLEEADGNVS